MCAELLQSYELPIVKGENYRSIVFYGKNLGLQVDKNITGFSILKNKGNRLLHNQYKIENGKAVLISSSDCSKIIFLQPLAALVCKISTVNNSYLMVSNSEMSNSNSLQKGSEDFSFDQAVLEQYPFILTQEIMSTHYCDASVCNSSSTGLCNSREDGQVYCGVSAYITDGPFCPKDEHEGVEPQDDQIQESVAQKQGRQAMYKIRDEILSLSTKGKQYIDFYYKLGYVFKVTETYTNKKAEMTEIMDFIDNKAAFFSSASLSDVIYNQTEADTIKTLIISFKTVTSNIEYQQILSTLNTDLNNLTGKTKSDILLYLM